MDMNYGLETSLIKPDISHSFISVLWTYPTLY